MKLYFMRHGETEWNRALKIQGRADIPLNENGRKEAAAAAFYFPDAILILGFAAL